MRRRLSTQVLALGLALVIGFGASILKAQDYPAKLIKIIVPFAPGGTTDYMARLIAEYITSKTGQRVVVENLGGGAGLIGMEKLAKSDPDGYTLGVATTGEVVFSKFLHKQLNFDPLRDISPVAMLGRSPQAFAINSEVPAKTMSEFIAYAKANPGKIRYASPGVGSVSHIGGYLLAKVSGLNMVHVPYHGSAPAMIDLLADRVQAISIAIDPIIGYAKTGKLRILTVADSSRFVEYLPDVPTSVEAGVPGYKIGLWWGLLAPHGIPNQIRDQLNSMMRALVADPTYRKRITDSYLIPISMSADEFANSITKEAPHWQRVIDEMGIHLD
jgi:tripartite-type tricarboxylate transporter receptor subunit TctC